MTHLAEWLATWSLAELRQAYTSVRPGSDYGKALNAEITRR